MYTTRRFTTGVLALALFAASACGGDDAGTGSGAALSDAEFCARILEIGEETSQLSEDEADAEFFSGLGGLIAAAPSAEMRAALTQFGEVAERLEALDDDDPEAFGEAFAIILDPGFLAATETLEGYLTDTCGFEDDVFGDSDFDDFDFDDFDTDDFDTDDSDGFSSADDDGFDFDRTYKALQRDPLVSASGMGASGGNITIFRDFAEPADPIEICESALRVLDETTGAGRDGFSVVIEEGDGAIAKREIGGVCQLP